MGSTVLNLLPPFNIKNAEHGLDRIIKHTSIVGNVYYTKTAAREKLQLMPELGSVIEYAVEPMYFL
jgi:hypothetical protein